MKSKLFTCMAMALALVLGPVSQAALLTNGFTFSSASGSGTANWATGTHLHSSTGGAFGNPAGKAEVGTFSSATGEQVRGLSEYNLAGVAAGPAFVTFNVFRLGGLFGQANYVGNIKVDTYLGNNAEDISDYQAASTGTIGSFSTAGLAVGNTVSLDITSLLAAALSAGNTSLGIRLVFDSATTPTGANAITFDTFSLTSTNNSTAGPGPGGGPGAPLPSAVWSALFSLAALGTVAKLRGMSIA